MWSINRRRSARRAAMQIVASVTMATVATAGLATTASAQDRYTDVTSRSHSSHKAYIEALEESGVFDGTECGARRFCPDEPAKRWTAAVWIVRVIDGVDPFPVTQSRFADVHDDEWWMPYVERLADLGITVGCKTNPLRFCPDETVTRARMASFLVRALRLQRAPSARFADTRGSTHEANIDALFAAGITVGCRQNPLRYCPDNPVSRAQMATLLNRGLDGQGTTGQSSTGSITVSAEPYSADTLIAAARGRTCTVRADGGVTCWGGEEGYLEHLSASGLDDIVALSTGDHPTRSLHSCAVHDNGDVSCWGPGSEGQLGQGDTSTHYLPVPVYGITDAVAVGAGPDFTCAVHRNGRVSCWGANRSGQLGDGTLVSNRYSPERVRGLVDVVAIAVGESSSCAVHDGGDLSCWGWPYDSTPETIQGLDAVSAVSIGSDRTCAVTDRREVYCWDSGGSPVGQPSRVGDQRDVVQVAVGDGTVCVLHDDGGVSCWGQNDVGQVGDATTTRRSQPVRLSGITDAVAISVSAGSPEVGAHACALHENRSISCWGGNNVGQLGDGTLRDGLTPRRVGQVSTIPARQVPIGSTELLLSWVDTVVDNREDDFPWLSVAWDFIRDRTLAGESGSGGFVDSECYSNAATGLLGCDVLSMTISEMSLGTVLHELLHVYDLHTGLAPPAAWGAVQLYFATTYQDCFTANHRGAEILADMVLHLMAPHARLEYYNSFGCPSLRGEPSGEAEEVVLDAFAGRVPDWYLDNIANGADLWETWLEGPSLPALANLAFQFGGRCRTDWVTVPLDPRLFPSANRDPFRDGGC